MAVNSICSIHTKYKHPRSQIQMWQVLWWRNPVWRLLVTAGFLLCSTWWSSGGSHGRSLEIFILPECKCPAFAWQLLRSGRVCRFSRVHEPLIRTFFSIRRCRGVGFQLQSHNRKMYRFFSTSDDNFYSNYFKITYAGKLYLVQVYQLFQCVTKTSYSIRILIELDSLDPVVFLPAAHCNFHLIQCINVSVSTVLDGFSYLKGHMREINKKKYYYINETLWDWATLC